MTLPPAGIRAVELSGIGPSRYCGMLLAELGAHVTLVTRPGEAPRRGDSVVGRSRHVTAADLKTPAGRGVVIDAAIVDGPMPGSPRFLTFTEAAAHPISSRGAPWGAGFPGIRPGFAQLSTK